jgi:hypothetical protein
MSGRISLHVLTAIGLAAFLAACAPRPRLKASWYLVYEPATEETYVRVEPAPYSTEPEPDPAPVQAPAVPSGVAAKPVGAVYVAIRNLGGMVAFSQVTLSADDQPIQRSKRKRDSYVLRPGEMMVLPFEAPPTGPSRACLLPTRLELQGIYPRKGIWRMRVAGALPTSLPDEWIEGCDGEQSVGPPAGAKGRKRWPF